MTGNADATTLGDIWRAFANEQIRSGQSVSGKGLFAQMAEIAVAKAKEG
ncbi:hypothetical protein NSU_3034 [Novosphingobium pentaromativorans US6-1]|uniref:Uncharacterized protein n=1 Tax=Novosphingobium pentaromativorans US6-1 TaxID=1088721 RepID=G6EFB3_9SPHN|nr:hypothetical protein NSU_3034 [Novosphingobium pentaromativorans US6-1]